MLSLKHIDSSWTLFLDRDGVLNVEKKEDYIRHCDEFQFYPEALEALPILAKTFDKIVITTNQKGIGKGLMTHEDLSIIHHNMLKKIFSVGGRIDDIFYCADLDNDSVNRKPQPGMAFQAKNDHPAIDFSKSTIEVSKTVPGIETAALLTRISNFSYRDSISLKADFIWVSFEVSALNKFMYSGLFEVSLVFFNPKLLPLSVLVISNKSVLCNFFYTLLCQKW